MASSVATSAAHVVERMADAVLRGDVDGALALIAPDAVDHSPLPGAPSGHEGWRQKWAALGAQAAQVQTTVEQRVALGDTVATRYALRDAATGEPVGFALDMLRVEDGRIVEHWGLPVPPAPAES
ncbi:ester cyclase [Frankia sp. AiPs1]|uniref:ester cyclase n=1 Tax=Frankia sp. AiPs1 TaxID=573493 RepID=UPI0020432931|nr:nuclear transport factor 2 family protein [Frankia sp. AiPs1]MCM3923599.1 ester cyclase [Frankia sp. AiPs1]